MFERWNQCFPLSQHCGRCTINLRLSVLCVWTGDAGSVGFHSRWKDWNVSEIFSGGQWYQQRWPGTSTVGLKAKLPGQLLIICPLAKMKGASDLMLTVGDLMNSSGMFLFLPSEGLHPKRLRRAVRQAAVLHWKPWFGGLRLDVCSLQWTPSSAFPDWLWGTATPRADRRDSPRCVGTRDAHMQTTHVPALKTGQSCRAAEVKSGCWQSSSAVPLRHCGTASSRLPSPLVPAVSGLSSQQLPSSPFVSFLLLSFHPASHSPYPQVGSDSVFRRCSFRKVRVVFL